MLCTKRLDPEEQKPLPHIWRPLYALNEMRNNPNYWGKTDEQHMDAGYCLDRYSLIEVQQEN